MQDSTQIVRDALNHKTPARVPLDLNGTVCTGAHVSCVAALRDWYGLEKRPVKMYEPYLGLGWVDPDLADALGLDIQACFPGGTIFGNSTRPLDKWKEFRAPWGQVVLVPPTFEWTEDANGDFLVYPQGDRSVPPAGRLAKASYFFDGIVRQVEIDDDNLDPRDNLEEFQLISDADMDFMAEELDRARATANGRAISAGTVPPGAGLGDIALVPGPMLKYPKGIRDIAEWYMSTVSRRDYLAKVFEGQVEIALENLKRLKKRFADAYEATFLCGADFGTQNSLFCSPEAFRELYVPFYRRMTGWIHENTKWKIMKHTCGAVEPLLDAIIDAGFDILNPVQCSAAGMDPRTLKKKYGDRLVFWGGGVDTQKTLPFGTPEQVRAEVLERCEVFAPKGGFVFAAVHDIQANTPTANIVAMVDAVHEFNGISRAK